MVKKKERDLVGKVLKFLAITAVIVFPFVLIYYFLILPNQKTIENVYDEIYFSSTTPWEEIEGVQVHSTTFYDSEMNETDLKWISVSFPKMGESHDERLGINKSYDDKRVPNLSIEVRLELSEKVTYNYMIYYQPFQKSLSLEKELTFMDRSDPYVENPDDIAEELKSFDTTQDELDKKALAIIEENVYQNWFKYYDSRFSMSDFGKYKTVDSE